MILINGVRSPRSGLFSDHFMIISKIQTARPLGLAVLLFMTSFLIGCSQRGLFEQPRDQAVRVAAEKGWAQRRYSGGDFSLLTFSSPNIKSTEPLNVYIEGDGFAWLDRYTPAKDPSPRNLVSLSLALKNQGSAVYLARPCQFLSPQERADCSAVFWTSARYSKEVVASLNAVIEQIKTEQGSTRIRLYGYSGGGVVAALLAMRRLDVIELITYGAPLDTRAWTALHGLSPLRYSLNPADNMRALRSVPQTHYVGEKDQNVPPALLYDFVERLNAGERATVRAKVIEIKGADHVCCW